MKQWNGLLKKEWVAMKGWFYGTIVASILLIFVLPFIFTLFFGGGADSLEVFLSPILLFGALLGVFMPSIILLVGFGKETDRPDIWLHSAGSIFKLFGSKVIFAAFVGAVNLVIFTLLLLLQLGFTKEVSGIKFNGEFIGNGGLVLLFLFFASLMMMCIALLFRVFFLVIKPYTKKLTLPILGVCFVVAASVESKITGSAIV